MLWITPDQMSAAGSYIAHEWGDYGYRIEEIESPTSAVSVFHVVASDGSRFTVLVDKWGNARYEDTHHCTTLGRRAVLEPIWREMHANATAA